ncbi:hypothetical protein AKJ16_DCAP14046 [Drosera capensis]
MPILPLHSIPHSQVASSLSPLFSTVSSLSLSPLLSPCHFVAGDSPIPISAADIVAADLAALPLAALQSGGCVSWFEAFCGFVVGSRVRV